MQEQPLEKHTALEPWAGQAARAHPNEGSSMDYSPKAPRAPHPRPFGTYCIGTFPGNPGSFQKAVTRLPGDPESSQDA